MPRVRCVGFLKLEIDVQTVPAKTSFKSKGCAEGVQMPGGFYIWPLLIPSLPKLLSSSESWAKERNLPLGAGKIVENVTMNRTVNFRVTEGVRYDVKGDLLAAFKADGTVSFLDALSTTDGTK